MDSPQSRAEGRLKAAIATLHDAIPKSDRSYLKDIPYPDLNNLGSVKLKAEELETAIEQFIQQREGYKLSLGRVKKAQIIIQKWFRASYPFAAILLNIAKTGPSVNSSLML